MTNETRYNGYANYETWAVVLWLENEEGTSRYWREAARELKKAAPDNGDVKQGFWTAEREARFKLALRLEDEVTDGGPELGPTLYADLLNAAFSEVEWEEVAEVFLEE